MAGRMVEWSIEFFEYHKCCEMRGLIKAQCLTEFVKKLVEPMGDDTCQCTLFVDGSSNSQGGGTGMVLQDPNGILLEQSLRFGFKASNN